MVSSELPGQGCASAGLFIPTIRRLCPFAVDHGVTGRVLVSGHGQLAQVLGKVSHEPFGRFLLFSIGFSL